MQMLFPAGILTEKGKVSYEIRPQAYGADEGNGSEAPVYTVTFHVAPDLSDRHISVEGSGALAGDYYPMEGSFLFPDVFVRYLSKADLCMWPTEDLSLLRNEIYAAHGRIFKSAIIQVNCGTGESSSRMCFPSQVYPMWKRRTLLL